ncbi:hypothetical protein L2E82_42219 [Cichorium intybus]|uniref:Uncharacterized protein n=1 Tax=Cichorium intybus TaxID=13427 RepID=A0ACB8ZKR9_CICIN|nr:hypothetical protein L2E82_42219 [Cichorium intybus]
MIFCFAVSFDYSQRTIKVLNMIKLYGKPIRVNKASQDNESLDVGANLFVGNLDPDVDEKNLYDTFSAFGVTVANPKITRDPEAGNSHGFRFISYDSFEVSDATIESMNEQYLCNRQITVSYAYKKDTIGEHHGNLQIKREHGFQNVIFFTDSSSDGVPKLEKSRMEKEALDHMGKLLGGEPRRTYHSNSNVFSFICSL